MEEKEFEHMLERLLVQDLSEGTEEFRETLLSRCLNELGADFRAHDLSDGDLDLLTAAGSPYLTQKPSSPDNEDF